MSGQKARRSLLDPAESRWDRQVTLDNVPGPKPYVFTDFNRDNLRRLKRSTKLLEQLLARALKEDLPALAWQVNEWAISGQPRALLEDAGLVRRQVEAWVMALGMDYREHPHGDGSIELAAATKLPAPGAPHLEVGVGIRVTIPPEAEGRGVDGAVEVAASS